MRHPIFQNNCRASGEKTVAVPPASRQGGVALLFVVLLTSVLLLVAIGITDVSYNEATFSVEAKDSDRAFFAADTGVECGLYLDKEALFGGGGTATPSCNDYLPTLVDSGGGNYAFAIPLGGQCAAITVDKHYIAADGTGPYTQISSIGYNVPADPAALPTSCVTAAAAAANPNIVTRALRTEYLNSGGSMTTTTTSTSTSTTTISTTSTSTTTTSSTPPSVTTVPAVTFGSGGATLSGILASTGGASSARVWFEYSTDADYAAGITTGSTPDVTMTTTGPFSVTVSGLVSGTTYHFAAYAIVGRTAVTGSEQTFIMP